jgi:hypothetical protein
MATRVVMPFTALASMTRGTPSALAFFTMASAPSCCTGVTMSTSTPLAMKSSAKDTCLAMSRLASAISSSMPSSEARAFMPFCTLWYHSCIM